jgi:hypothetical protein
LETGTDVGNFRGVALYRQGTEVVLVTEMEAGWYRYVHEWGFDAGGTIHPRFGFGATANSCTGFPTLTMPIGVSTLMSKDPATQSTRFHCNPA